MSTEAQSAAGMEALHRLKSTEPALFLSPSEDLSVAARLASEHLYSSLKPFTPKAPFAQLLTKGFDAEQIWQQIDLQFKPLNSSLIRQIKHYQKNPEELANLFTVAPVSKVEDARESHKSERESLGVEDDEMDGFDDEEDADDEDIDGLDDQEDAEDEEIDGADDDDEDVDGEEEGSDDEGVGVEDRFLKIKELEEYLEDDEAREYGLKRDKRKRAGHDADESEDDGGEEDGVNDSEDEEGYDELLGGLNVDGGDEEHSNLENARYEDFFDKKKSQNKKSKPLNRTSDPTVDKLPNRNDDNRGGNLSTFEKELHKRRSFIEEMDQENLGQKDWTMQGEGGNLSTFEKELQQRRSIIEEMEQENLGQKDWTMQGEVTAAKRPKNSALEVDLDFEHNVRPAPVITEEVTATLEELIQKRIVEGDFDDVQKPPSLPFREPKQIKELDENKSKKGLAEIYEEEYVQKTGLVSTAISFSDEQKKEASMLFKKLCLKLDALSHFHFTPKPVIEDMSIQANVPALAMEEIAPLAVSDAAMLAPEEVFSGKGDIKEETELNQAERKRRRARKKRKYKADEAKRMQKKTQQRALDKVTNRDE